MSLQREVWPSRFAFISAALGSAIGLGNVWRFSYLAGKYGGSAFLFPYLIALLLLCVPVMILEFALGHRFKTTVIQAFQNISDRLKGVGLLGNLSSFIILPYYAVIVGWCLLYLYHSLNTPWVGQESDFFYSTILNLSPGAFFDFSLNIPLIIAVAICWIVFYLCISRGIAGVSKVVSITVPLPIIILFILLVRGVTLPHGMDGITYFFKPRFDLIWDFNVWRAAFSQIVFTASLGFGTMVAFASYLPKKSDIVKNSLITVFLNSAVSIIAGAVVFSTLGYMAFKQGVPIDTLAKSGPGLAFIVFPKALSLIPYPHILSFLFFLCLLTLAVDSAFALLETLCAALVDRFPRYSRSSLLIFSTVVCAVISLIYTTGSGLYFLDVVDHFVSDYLLVGTVLLQCIAFGWIANTEEWRRYINSISDIRIGSIWTFSLRFICPLALIILLSFSLYSDFSTPYEDYPQSLLWVGQGVCLLAFIVSFYYSFFSSKRNTQ